MQTKKDPNVAVCYALQQRLQDLQDQRELQTAPPRRLARDEIRARRRFGAQRPAFGSQLCASHAKLCKSHLLLENADPFTLKESASAGNCDYESHSPAEDTDPF